MIDTSYSNSAYDRRYGGTILLDNQEVANTVQCCHCGDHFTMVRGSGKTRGWCTRCSGFVCGAKCQDCKPFELQLLAMEGKVDLNALPVSVSVPRAIGG